MAGQHVLEGNWPRRCFTAIYIRGQEIDWLGLYRLPERCRLLTQEPAATRQARGYRDNDTKQHADSSDMSCLVCRRQQDGQSVCAYYKYDVPDLGSRSTWTQDTRIASCKLTAPTKTLPFQFALLSAIRSLSVGISMF
jgi:hypothetical protein